MGTLWGPYSRFIMRYTTCTLNYVQFFMYTDSSLTHTLNCSSCPANYSTCSGSGLCYPFLNFYTTKYHNKQQSYSDDTSTELPFRLHHEAWMKSDGITCPAPQKCFGCCYSYPSQDVCTDCVYQNTLVISCSELTKHGTVHTY